MHHLTLNARGRSGWCQLYLKAAQAAERMQSALRSSSTGSSMDSLSSLAFEEPRAGAP